MNFPLFMTVKVGVRPKTLDGMLKSLKRSGTQIDHPKLGKPYPTVRSFCSDAEFCLAKQEEDVRLCIVSIEELGSPKPTLVRGIAFFSVEKIHARARELGLWLCPDETGLRFRAAYVTQPRKEILFMATEPIVTKWGYYGFLALEQEKKPIIRVAFDGPGCFLLRDTKFVFRLPD